MALLMRSNPRNRLEYPTVSMPRVFTVGNGEKVYRIRCMVMGRSRIGRFDSGQNLTNVTELTKRNSCNLLSQLFFVFDHPRPAMA